MPIRTEAQTLGSSGQSLVTHIINSTGEWIARSQNEDFGIDLEAELADPHVSGQLIKIQVKASRSVKVSEKGIACQIPKDLVVYADSSRLPVVLVTRRHNRHKASYGKGPTMIETTLLHGWATLVKCAALIAIVVLALGLIVRAVKLGNVMRHLGVIVGIMILLLMLPAIILSEWSSMSFFQQFGIAFLGIVVVLLFNKMRCAPKSTRRS